MPALLPDAQIKANFVVMKKLLEILDDSEQKKFHLVSPLQSTGFSLLNKNYWSFKIWIVMVNGKSPPEKTGTFVPDHL